MSVRLVVVFFILISTPESHLCHDSLEMRLDLCRESLGTRLDLCLKRLGMRLDVDNPWFLPSPFQDLAELDPAFNANFSCPQKSGFVSLKGTIRALCRLCANITDPVNGLVLDRNAQCLPSPSSKFSTLLYCWGISSINQLSECQGVHSKGGYVNPHISNEDGRRTMKYYAMTFLSVSILCMLRIVLVVDDACVCMYTHMYMYVCMLVCACVCVCVCVVFPPN